MRAQTLLLTLSCLIELSHAPAVGKEATHESRRGKYQVLIKPLVPSRLELESVRVRPSPQKAINGWDTKMTLRGGI